MPLTELQVKPTVKELSPIADEKGMRLLVRVTGSKTWQLSYTRPYENKADIFTLGTYPELTLKQARLKRDEARALITQGIDPKQHQKSNNKARRLTSETLKLSHKIASQPLALHGHQAIVSALFFAKAALVPVDRPASHYGNHTARITHGTKTRTRSRPT